MRISGKKGTFEFSLESFGEIALVTIGIIAFAFIISAVFGVFSNPDEDQGSYEGYIALVSKVIDMHTNGRPSEVRDFNAFVKDDTVIVAFPKGKQEIEGACKDPNVLSDFLVNINPPIIKVRRTTKTCPINNACLCLCKESFGTFSGTKEMIDCNQAACVPFYKDTVKDIDFIANSDPDTGCKIPLLYGEDDTVHYDVKEDSQGRFSFVFVGNTN